MLTLRLHLSFARETYGEALAALRTLVGPVRAEPGCMGTRLTTGADESRELTWTEDWRSAAQFEDHLRGASFRRILAVIELAAAPPEVEIDDVTCRRGFDLIEAILDQRTTERKETES